MLAVGQRRRDSDVYLVEAWSHKSRPKYVGRDTADHGRHGVRCLVGSCKHCAGGRRGVHRSEAGSKECHDVALPDGGGCRVTCLGRSGAVDHHAVRISHGAHMTARRGNPGLHRLHRCSYGIGGAGGIRYRYLHRTGVGIIRSEDIDLSRADVLDVGGFAVDLHADAAERCGQRVIRKIGTRNGPNRGREVSAVQTYPRSGSNSRSATYCVRDTAGSE
jgi:hypothetical protein